MLNCNLVFYLKTFYFCICMINLFFNILLIPQRSKRSDRDLAGRNDGNQKVIFPAVSIPEETGSKSVLPIKPGDYVAVEVITSVIYPG